MNDPLPLFVAPETLAQALDRADIQIVAVDSSADFTDAHIPGACQLAMADLMATAPPVGGLLPSDHALQDLFSSIGLRNDAQIVAYDRVGDGQAARLLWTLDAMGRDDIALLDGGLRAWHAAGLDLEAGAPASEPGDFQVQRRPERIADRQWIESHLNDDQVVTLDVRSAAEYAGSDVRSARGGHIPGAVNIDWEDLKNADGQLRPRAELVEDLRRSGRERKSGHRHLLPDPRAFFVCLSGIEISGLSADPRLSRRLVGLGQRRRYADRDRRRARRMNTIDPALRSA